MGLTRGKNDVTLYYYYYFFFLRIFVVKITTNAQGYAKITTIKSIRDKTSSSLSFGNMPAKSRLLFTVNVIKNDYVS